MKSKLMIAISAAAVVVAVAGSTLAQRGPGSGHMMGGMGGPNMMDDQMGMMGRGGWGMGPMMRGGMMGGCGMGMGMRGGRVHAAGRAAFLKAELGITEAQQELWAAYEKALKSNFEAMEGMHQTMMAAMDAKSPVERLEFRLTAMEGRISNLKALKEPLSKLYAALSDEQKEKANSLMTGMGCMM